MGPKRNSEEVIAHHLVQKWARFKRIRESMRRESSLAVHYVTEMIIAFNVIF